MFVDLELGALNPKALGELERIGGIFMEAREKGWPLHKFEEELWKILLWIGHSAPNPLKIPRGQEISAPPGKLDS